MDERMNEDQNLGKVDEIEIEPLTDEALDSVAGGLASASQPDSCTSCCSCQSCS
jgi:hypothetical protein